MTAFDPQEFGARCDVCILSQTRVGGPVPAEIHPGEFAVVGEAPGEAECLEGRPFVGPSGMELMQAIGAAGVSRRDATWTNALLCRPPNNDLTATLKMLSRVNKKRVARGDPPLPTPIQACHPRLMRDLQGRTGVIAVGSAGFRAVTGESSGIMDVRGGMVDGWATDAGFVRAEGIWDREPPGGVGTRRRVLPTVHPAFVLRARRWTRVFRSDVARGIRWFRGYSDWVEPEIEYTPTPEDLDRFLRTLPIAAYDVETDGIEPLTARMRCVSIGDGNRTVVVPWLGIDGTSTFYTEDDQRRIADVLRAFFVNPNIVKVGHNAGYYDRMLIESVLGVTPKPLIDTILLHRVVESELPHRLGFVASLYAALSPAWKADRTATTAQTDYQLWHYCAIDVAQTYRVLDPLSRHVGIMRQETAFKADTKMQSVCVDMHRNGLRVDQRRRAQWEYHYSAIAYEWRARCEEIAADLGFKNHNPGSVHQVRDLIYDKCGVSIPDGANGKPKITRGGDPSTDDEAMRAIWVADTTPRDAKIYINALRRYRAAQKVLGTYLFRLRPQAMIADGLAEGIALIDLEDAANDDGTLQEGVDPYELAADRQRRRRIDRDRRRGVVWPDGRVRSSFNAHVTTVGRIASSGPNLLNVPSVLKDIFVPEDGRIFVGADADQIHLRIAAARWRISRYIEAFRLGADPHAMTAFLIFGDAFRTATGFPKGEWVGDYFILAPGAKWKGQAKVYRDLSKRVQYASLYKATPETVWRVVKESEEADGRLTYAALALDEVRRMHADWLGGAPEVKDGWAYELELYQQKGYGEDPTVGRRRLFLDGKNENEVINFPILAAEAGLMGAATVGIAEDLPAGYAGPGTGVVHQNYDSICLEVPIRDLARARRLLHERMNYDHPALPGVRFSGEVGAGLNLKAA